MLHAPVVVDPSMPSRRPELATVLGMMPNADAPNQEVTTGEAAKDDHEARSLHTGV